MFDCDSNERIVEGSSTPDQGLRSMAPDDVENGLWGLRITIERLDLIPQDFSDVFCQFSLFGRCEESWSTEPIQIAQGSANVDTSWELAVKSGPELVKVMKKIKDYLLFFFIFQFFFRHSKVRISFLKFTVILTVQPSRIFRPVFLILIRQLVSFLH